MADTLTTALMSLTLPVPGARLGPQWAVDLNAALASGLDGHDHSPGKGALITPAGMNITGDLTFNSYNATALRSTRYATNAAPLSGVADLACVYFVGNDLYCNDGAGNQIRLTAGGVLNAAALTSAVWAATSVSTNYSIAPSNTFVAFFIDTTGARTITLPSAAGVTGGRFYLFWDVSGLSETNAITVTPNGADKIAGVSGSTTLKANYGVWALVSDGASNWWLWRSGSEVNGAKVPKAGSLTTGNVLQVNGAASLTYAPINLAGGSNYVTGILPAANLGTATTGQSGAVKLAQDLAGTALLPKVVGVSGGGTDPFVLGSDLQGNAVTTIQLGTDGLVFPRALLGTQALFGMQALNASGTAHPLKITGQDYWTGGTGQGGPLLIQSGASHGAIAGDTNVNGYVQIGVGGNPQLHLAEMVTGRFVIGLGSTVNSSNMPTGSGSQVLWIAPATSVPTVAPGSGSVLYSNAGAFGWFNSVGHQLEIPGTINSGATAGAFSMVTTVDGYLNVKVDGASYKIPLCHP